MAIKRKRSIVRKKVQIRTDKVWIKYILIALIFLLFGSGSTYYLTDGGRSIRFFLESARLENELKRTKAELSGANQKLQSELEIKNITHEKIINELNTVKTENNDLKENIMFYEKILGKKGK